MLEKRLSYSLSTLIKFDPFGDFVIIQNTLQIYICLP